VIEIRPTGIVFHPDKRRVLARPFVTSNGRGIQSAIARALSLDEDEVARQLATIQANFRDRHLDIESCWRRTFSLVKSHLPEGVQLEKARQLYIGALFSGEYALESAALFNPSIVPHPDQSDVPVGSLRFVLSLRATGEGHISSIEFRSGIIPADSTISVDEVSRFVSAPGVKEDPTYRKTIFQHKLQEMGFENDWSWQVINSLRSDFTRRELDEAIRDATEHRENLQRENERTLECIQWLAMSNYEVHFPPPTTLSQRTIFPVSPNESNGIEDARFVRFCEDDGSTIYYATFTAYNGHAILPQFIETRDFASFAVCTLNGQAVQNKGMALFPRRINGRFVMVSRQDDENLFLMTSDNVHFWNEPKLLRTPAEPWEFVKIGNCGSPIETEDGWLLLTHGVGPMRRYCIGAILLDLEDPSRVIGSLREPLLAPTDEEREGYVPNVVYSCGALVHAGRLILPYAVSDTSSTIVTIDLEDLLAGLRPIPS
jgi:predicted GH43/DUF377 family glycosyl hydrolase